MVSIALIVLGLALGVVGLLIAALPLTLVGAVWIVCGLISRAYAARINRIRRQQKAAAGRGSTLAGATAASVGTVGAAVTGTVAATDTMTPTAAAASGAAPPAPHQLATMLVLTTTCLASGLSALAVGYFQLGFDAAHEDWHWLPLIAGIPPTALAVISLGMYGLGSAAEATFGEPPTIPAVIVVLSVRETGVYVNERPRLEFELEVRPEGGEAYQVTKRATVPFTALANVGAGHAFHATVVGPSDATNMDIDWSSGFDTTDGPDGDAADPATRLRELDELRRQGLVTDAEYTAQRARIIGSV